MAVKKPLVINNGTIEQLQSGDSIEVDLDGYLKKDGSVAMTGDFDLGSQKIVNVADATASGHAVNKAQLDEYVPAGKVAYFAMSTAPAGYLKCNGAEISRETYANLFAAIGTTFGAGDESTTFNLPDLRGEFIRGFDDERGIDSGRTFGSLQLDALQNITGSVSGSQLYLSGTGAFEGAGSTAGQRPANGTATKQTVTFDASRVARTAEETRPRNIALLACIKY
jgi:phage-related tail fiber protein